MTDLSMVFNLCVMCLILMMMALKYMLMMLMAMELLVISISLVIFMNFSMYSLEFFMIYYVIFSVCESVLGLMLLIKMVRFYGNEQYSVVNLNKFNIDK
uniref:NADH dehydrogenase subunit 4L n=1 Tax=Buniapone amblyops TaxID=613574 RepID=UPI002A811178|nr:NADH dehydrogenase subunit 4L [Buniapone amblyops]WON66599.1 NADH dehydrogenase subunit 4L [Buniapone amblyops]